MIACHHVWTRVTAEVPWFIDEAWPYQAHADGLQTRRKLQDAEAHASQLQLEAVRLRAELTSMASVTRKYDLSTT